MKYYECKIRYEKQITDTSDKECGKLKKVNETYLTGAENCTEAEARMVSEVVPYIKGEWKITQQKEVQIAEIIGKKEDPPTFYSVKVKMTVADEQSGKEKTVSENVLVNAGSIKEAIEKFDRTFKNTMTDYEVTAVTKSAILEIFD